MARMWHIGLVMLVLWFNMSSASAQTPPVSIRPAPLATAPALDQTATQILAQYTATAEAFPVPPEQVDAFGLFTFTLAIGSMLLVLLPLGVGFWWLNRGK